MAAYNEEARRLGKELVKIDEKISAALRAEAALRCKGSVASASSTSKPSADLPRGRAPKGKKGGAAGVKVSTSSSGSRSRSRSRPTSSSSAKTAIPSDTALVENTRKSRTARQTAAVAAPRLTPGQVRLPFVKSSP